MNQEEVEKANKLKLDRLKGTWYHATPDKLYDLCVKKVTRNIDLILVKSCNDSKRLPKSRYRVRETVGPLPSPICESLIREYARFYVETLAQLEREEYFNTDEARKQSTPSRVISYYDVLMAFVCTPSKCSLNSVDYRQCMWATSALETRLKQKLEAQVLRNEPIRSNYFKVVENRAINKDNRSVF